MRRRTAFGSLLAVTAFLAACGESIAPPIPTTLTLSPTSLTLALGESAGLSALVSDQFGGAMFEPVTWSSSRPSVASVGPSGIVEAVAPGTALITASVAGLQTSAQVTVLAPFVLSISATVTSAGFNTQSNRYECRYLLTASAQGGTVDASAEWRSGEWEFRYVNGTVQTILLDATDLLDYFGSSRISTGATQIANRIAWASLQFDLVYTIRANMSDGTLSSTLVFVNCLRMRP